MTGIDSVVLKQAIIHKVGNPTRGEELKLSANQLTLNDEIVRGLLTKYFLGSLSGIKCSMPRKACAEYSESIDFIIESGIHLFWPHPPTHLLRRGARLYSAKFVIKNIFY